jgi:hypothetical protein
VTRAEKAGLKLAALDMERLCGLDDFEPKLADL